VEYDSPSYSALTMARVPEGDIVPLLALVYQSFQSGFLILLIKIFIILKH